MDGAEVTAIGALVAALLVLSEVIKALMFKLMPQKENGKNGNHALLKEVISLMREVLLVQATQARVQTKQSEILETMARQLDHLDQWHNKTDEDGVPLGYSRRSFEKAVVSLNQAIMGLNETLTVLTQNQKTMHRKIDGIQDDIQEIRMNTRDEVSGVHRLPPGYKP